MCDTVHMWKSEDSFLRVILSSYHAGPGDQVYVFGLGGESHLTSPKRYHFYQAPKRRTGLMWKGKDPVTADRIDTSLNVCVLTSDADIDDSGMKSVCLRGEWGRQTWRKGTQWEHSSSQTPVSYFHRDGYIIFFSMTLTMKPNCFAECIYNLKTQSQGR